MASYSLWVVFLFITIVLFCLGGRYSTMTPTMKTTAARYTLNLTSRILEKLNDTASDLSHSQRQNSDIVKAKLEEIGTNRSQEHEELLTAAREQLRLGLELQSQILHVTTLALETLNVSKQLAERFSGNETRPKPRDCAEVKLAGNSASGVYSLYPNDSGYPFSAYCDMDTDGGNWTVSLIGQIIMNVGHIFHSFIMVLLYHQTICSTLLKGNITGWLLLPLSSETSIPNPLVQPLYSLFRQNK